MNWEFNLGWFILGIVLMVAGLLVLKFHRWIGDNMASGLASYDKIKIAGIVTSIVGIVFMSNLHTLILYFIFHLIMPNQFP